MEPKDNSPYIRGSQAKTNIKLLKLLGPEKEQKILRRISPSILNSIREASRVDWLPLTMDIEITESVHAETGDQGLYDWSIKTVLESMDGPLLGPMVRGAIRLFSINPKELLQFSKRGWDAVFKNCGYIEIHEDNPTSVRATVVNATEIMVKSHAYRLGIGASFDGVFVMARVDGKVTVESYSLENQQIVYRANWKKPSKH